MHAISRLGLALSLSLLTACGGGDPATQVDQGYEALGKGDAEGALAKFERALGKLQPADGAWLRAKMGVIDALVAIDADRARDALIALAKEQPQHVTAQDYLRVASAMVTKNKLAAAGETLKAGEKSIAGNPKAVEVEKTIKERAAKATDPGEIARLKSLGYL
jgi:hypothetical protein